MCSKVWLYVATMIALVLGNDDDACSRSLLPWDFDLFPYVDRDTKDGEVHINGEYLLYQKGEEKYSEKYQGIIHKMTICPNGCENTMFIRYSISPLKVADFRLILIREDEKGVEHREAESQGNGRTIEQQIAAELLTGVKYFIMVVYNTAGDTMPRCAAVWMELVYARHSDYSQPKALCTGNEPTAPNLNIADQVKKQLEEDPHSEIPTSYKYETDLYRPPSKMDVFTSVHVKAPEIRGHDGFWKLRMEIRASFLTGGHWLAFLSTDKKSTLDSTDVIHGTRGTYKNVYILEQMVTSLEDYYLHIASISGHTGEKPKCTSFYVVIDLEATTIDESFMTCGIMPLPDSLNSPGFYDPKVSKEMAIAHNVLLSSKALSQNTSLEVEESNLIFKVTVAHSTIDVSLKLYEDGKHLVSAWIGVYGPEGITVVLKPNTKYRLHIEHVFDPMAFSGTSIHHCNSAVLRMEIGSAPPKKTILANVLPDLKLPSSITDDWSFQAPASEGEFPYMMSYTKPQQELIEHYEMNIEVPGELQIFIPNRFLHGEVVASVASLHESSVQLSEFVLKNDNTNLQPSSVSSPCGYSPQNEGVENLIKSDKSKWLDFNKSPVVFTFEEETEISGYLFITANDYSRRDPVEWVLYGTNSDAVSDLGPSCTDLSHLTKVHEQTESVDKDLVPLSRYAATPTFKTDRVSYKHYVFVPTMMRGTDPRGDFQYSESKLDGSFMSVALQKGRYRFSLRTGWGDLYKTEDDVIPKCVSFGLKMKFSKYSTCPLRMIDEHSKMGTLTRAHHYMYGEYQIPISGVLDIDFEIKEGSHIHLDIIASDLATQSIKLILPDGSEKGANDWFQDGLSTLSTSLPNSGLHKLSFQWDNPSQETCVGFHMQLAISVYPKVKPVCDTKTIDTIAPLIQNLNSENLPFYHSEKYKTKPGNEAGDTRLRIPMYLDQDSEIRSIINYNYETMHVYLSICKCPDDAMAREELGCWECEDSRSTSIPNGNHLPAQKLLKGHYEVKFREPPNTLITSFCNEYLVTMLITVLTSDKNTEAPVLCGHSELLGRLMGPGLIDGTINEMHFMTEALVPKAVPRERPVARTHFEVHVDSVIRVWIPKRSGISVNNTNLFQLQSNTMQANRFWPHKSQVGYYGVNSDTGSIFHRVPKGYYNISITFNKGCSMKCLTYDFEISIIPETSLARMKDDSCTTSELPQKLDFHSHTELKRSFPNSETSFMV